MERYSLLEPIGTGAAATVYRARDELVGRDVALKVLRRSEGSDDLALALREARAASQLDFVEVVRVHDVGTLAGGEHAGCAYIAMELIRGRSLRSYVGDSTVPFSTRIEWIESMARALALAHEAGLVHRDVKPDNVMVTLEGQVKMLDFGIARRAPLGDLATQSAVDVADALKTGNAGTPAYMAPERMLGAPADAYSDQFGWGVSAYELLFGSLPWGSNLDPVQLVAAILNRAPQPVRHRDVPDPVLYTVYRALEKHREKRFLDMRSVQHALRSPRRNWRLAAYAAGSAATLGIVAALGLYPRAPIPTALDAEREMTTPITETPSLELVRSVDSAPAARTDVSRLPGRPKNLVKATPTVHAVEPAPPAVEQDAGPATPPEDPVRALYNRH